MRKSIFALFVLTWIGCAGSGDSDPSPFHKLCMDACAHIHERNCLEAPAVDVGNCNDECATAATLVDSPCTDEQAALYACTAKSTIICSSASGLPPTPKDCDAEQKAANSCDSPGTACLRSPGSDDICFQFGLKQFFECSEGTGPNLGCVQVTGSGFCC